MEINSFVSHKKLQHQVTLEFLFAKNYFLILLPLRIKTYFLPFFFNFKIFDPNKQTGFYGDILFTDQIHHLN